MIVFFCRVIACPHTGESANTTSLLSSSATRVCAAMSALTVSSQDRVALSVSSRGSAAADADTDFTRAPTGLKVDSLMIKFVQ